MNLKELFHQIIMESPVSAVGVGAVPNNMNVDYLGLRVLMKPSTFLKLAYGLKKPTEKEMESVDYFIGLLINNKKLGTPFLGLEPNEDDTEFKVTGHEGRHRMIAIQMTYGDKPVEVHLFFGQGMRNRDITPEIEARLMDYIISQNGKRINKPIVRIK